MLNVTSFHSLWIFRSCSSTPVWTADRKRGCRSSFILSSIIKMCTRFKSVCHRVWIMCRASYSRSKPSKTSQTCRVLSKLLRKSWIPSKRRMIGGWRSKRVPRWVKFRTLMRSNLHWFHPNTRGQLIFTPYLIIAVSWSQENPRNRNLWSYSRKRLWAQDQKLSLLCLQKLTTRL